MEAKQVDDLLLPFINASDEAASEHHLSRLITDYAEPIVTRILKYKSGNARRASQRIDEHARNEDIHGEIMLQLVLRLRQFRAEHLTRPIADFNAYVAVTTYNAYDRYISRSYPQRRRLKNGLRYLLTHHNDFALWQTKDGSWIGGFERWRTPAHNSAASDAVGAAIPPSARLQQLRDDPRAFARDAKAHHDWHDRKHAYQLLATIFEWTGVSVELDLLTSVMADWWNVTDEAVELDAGRNSVGRDEGAGIQVVDQRPAVTIEIERRAYLKRLWEEITDLPARQRAALLLNLRDEGGRGIVDLWIIVGIATPESLAKTLNLETQAFAELWKELPFDDHKIAAHLGLTRQQVINLRKSARERLARRVKAS